ncbi:GDSL-type esterase/lipase family protein [Bombilactobacillus thymidiniphilus]|uniref:GDSL-type esterase/lipase family protein n=1 Tax=Bombilactobacillus thymidiniphilus TaxID=2923363 RepID=A0ABY4PDL6_9LACO|nr:GDSL-type esterase/lipase family protein [Bombilactobacillus thymidiniphilus]UQS83710.1 GDSL-type esterase/lipase family protein [Bombilactobacillus thymidiniphilus]
MKKLQLILAFLFAGILFWHNNSTVLQAHNKTFVLTAVGDSLTYGVGDSTKRGGYTYLIKKPLKKATKAKVIVNNYGISGQTSAQIVKRFQKDRELQKSLQKSKIITITAGGNDVMAALRKHGVDLSAKQLLSYQNQYDAHLNKMIQISRHFNPHAPIYVFSIYNPYEIYFKKAQGMKAAVKNWNKSTRQIAQDNYRVHYVDITKLATPKKIVYSKKDKTTTNPLLYKKDYFHPNNQGYRLMTNLLWQQMKRTKAQWR